MVEMLTEPAVYFHSFTKILYMINARDMIITNIGVPQHRIMTLTMNGATVFVSMHFA